MDYCVPLFSNAKSGDYLFINKKNMNTQAF